METIKDLEDVKGIMNKKMEIITKINCPIPKLKLSTKIDLQERVKDLNIKLETLAKENEQLRKEIQEVKNRICSIQNYLKERG